MPILGNRLFSIFVNPYQSRKQHFCDNRQKRLLHHKPYPQERQNKRPRGK
jgi:hypothetical protein